MSIFRLIISLFVFSLTTHLSYACSTVFSNLPNQPQVVARTLDLYVPDSPMLVTYPRGTEHDGGMGSRSLKWKTKYGSLAVTAFHSDAVSDGLNEKGLAIHLLYLSGSQYPAVDNTKPQISNLKWGQYVLDNFASVDEVVKNAEHLQLVATELRNRTWPLHLAVEDKTGDSAIIEFINGKMDIYHGHQYQVMTNEPAYHIQLENVKRYRGFGGTLSLPGDPDPLSRFVRLATFIKTLPAPENEIESIAGVLSVIRSAMVPFGAVDTSGSETEAAWVTRWVSVADMTNNIYYFNSTSAPNTVWVDLSKINLAEGAPSLSVDPTNIHLEGDITNKLMP